MAEVTTVEKIVNKVVIKDTLRAVLDKKVSMIPFANVDTTLEGEQGSTITVSRYTFDGIAQEIKEGDAIPIRALGTESAQYTVKMAGEGTSVTDMAVLSAAGGNVVGAAAEALGDSIYGKIDTDMYTELLKAPTVFDANDVVKYENIVDAQGLFHDEGNMEMIMFAHPDIVTTLRKDNNFIDKNKYDNNVMMGGEIGMVGTARVVRSRRCEPVGGFYYSPIVVTNDPDHKDDLAAITYFMKRDTNVEVERIVRRRLTEITADQIYVVALTNGSKVVLLKTTGANTLVKSMYDEEYEAQTAGVTIETTKVDAKVAITRTNATTWAAAMKFNSGIALELTAAQKTALGLDNTATHYLTCEIEIPGAGISETAPTVSWNGTNVPANEMQKIGGSWYFDAVLGVKDNNGAVVPAGNASFTVICGGITTTITPDYSGIKLA